jgi:hypothetical protein
VNLGGGKEQDLFLWSKTTKGICYVGLRFDRQNGGKECVRMGGSYHYNHQLGLDMGSLNMMQQNIQSFDHHIIKTKINILMMIIGKCR